MTIHLQLLVGALGVFAGLVMSRFGGVGNFVVVSGACLVAVLLKMSLVKNMIGGLVVASLVAAFCVGFAFGAVRGGSYLGNLNSIVANYGNKVTLNGRVINDPVYGFRGQLSCMISLTSIDNVRVVGRARLSGHINSLKMGDEVVASGKLREGFAGWQASVSFAQIKVVSEDSSLLAKQRSKFIANINSLLPDAQASLGLGFLIGVRSLIEEDLKNNLSETGLTHIVAVSGYNLTVLIVAARSLLQSRSRKGSALFAACLLWGFVLVVGPSPSVQRASIVSSMSLFAWIFGRQFYGLSIIVFSATVSAWLDPYYMWFDLGWHLSFLAFIGILVVAPRIMTRAKSAGRLKVMLVETASAQLMTAPLIMFMFSKLSIVAMLSNALILPLVPVAMVLTFIVGCVATINFSAAAWLSWPCTQLLEFMVEVIELLASPSWASVWVNFSYWQFLFSFVLIAVWLFVLGRWQALGSSNRQ